jgi:hypothetical protein
MMNSLDGMKYLLVIEHSADASVLPPTRVNAHMEKASGIINEDAPPFPLFESWATVLPA